ncbi:MAG: FAD-dependent oxidoreductase, partial [Gammaproteobacteria bacterium]
TCGEALFLPGVCQVRNPRLLKALRIALKKEGVAILEQRPVTGLLHDGHRVLGAETPAGPLAAELVILATGAWSGPLLRRLRVAAGLRPVRGQMLAYRAKPGLLHSVVVRDERYLVPREDGLILAGSTLEYAGLDCRTTPRARLGLEMAAMRLLPALAETHVLRQWAGLRPGSPRGIPAIGVHPALEGLYLSIGHFRNGLLTAPASAALLGDLVSGRPPSIDPRPYRVEVSGRLR